MSAPARWVIRSITSNASAPLLFTGRQGRNPLQVSSSGLTWWQAPCHTAGMHLGKSQSDPRHSPALHRTALASACVAFMWLWAPHKVLGQPSFQEMVLPTGLNAAATGVSESGNVAVGWSTYGWSFGQLRAFRWTSSGGIENLGGLPDMPNSRATGVSEDGDIVVGYASGNAGALAFRWTPSLGVQSLGVLPSFTHSYALAVSGDGTTVVGSSQGPGGFQSAFRWTDAAGMLPLIPASQTTPQSTARAVNRDGTVVVGSMSTLSGERAFRWTPSGGVVDMGLPVGATEAAGSAVSDDGDTVAGWAVYPGADRPQRAFRWRQETGFEDVGCLPGMTEPRVTAITADGVLAIGYCISAGGGTRGFAWSSVGGMVSLDSFVEGLGLDLQGRSLAGAFDITENGTSIATRSNDAIVIRGLPPACSRPIILLQPSDTWVAPSTSLTFLCDAVGQDVVQQWTRNGSLLVDSERVSGSRSSMLVIAGFGAADQGTYQCVVSNSCDTEVSDSVQASCRGRVLVEPSGAAVRAGTRVVLPAGVSVGGATTYRWKKDGINLFNAGAYAGVTTPTLTIHANDPSQSGSYTLAITNPCGVTTTIPAVVEVSCAADWNGDGGVDGDDVILFFQQWDENNSEADFTGDGSVDGDDVIGFFERWDAGC